MAGPLLLVVDSNISAFSTHHGIRQQMLQMMGILKEREDYATFATTAPFQQNMSWYGYVPNCPIITESGRRLISPEGKVIKAYEDMLGVNKGVGVIDLVSHLRIPWNAVVIVSDDPGPEGNPMLLLSRQSYRIAVGSGSTTVSQRVDIGGLIRHLSNVLRIR